MDGNVVIYQEKLQTLAQMWISNGIVGQTE